LPTTQFPSDGPKEYIDPQNCEAGVTYFPKILGQIIQVQKKKGGKNMKKLLILCRVKQFHHQVTYGYLALRMVLPLHATKGMIFLFYYQILSIYFTVHPIK
jgi:hypothetical protein